MFFVLTPVDVVITISIGVELQLIQYLSLRFSHGLS